VDKNQISEKKRILVIDFKSAVFEVFKFIFKDSEVYGCFFHFAQMVWKRVISNGLTVSYKNEKNVKLAIKSIINMAVIPPKNFVESLSELERFIFSIRNENLTELYLQMYKTFFSTFNKCCENECISSIYNFKFWSVYSRILDNVATTTNSVEKWHSGINRTVRIAHPSLINLVDSLRKIQTRVNHTISRLKLGRSNNYRSRSRKYEMLKNILSNFKYYKGMEF
jgi:hypothetical protein